MNKLYDMKYEAVWQEFKEYNKYQDVLIDLYNEKKENEFWKKAINKNTEKTYKQYVSFYPHGKYVDEAKIKIAIFIKLKKEEELEKIKLQEIKIKQEKEKRKKEQHQQISLYLKKNEIFFNSFPKLKNELIIYLTIQDLNKLLNIVSILSKTSYIFQEFNIIITKLIKLGLSKEEALSFIKLSNLKNLVKDFKVYSHLINQVSEQKLSEWKPIDKQGKSVCPWLINESKAWIDRQSNKTFMILPKKINYIEAISITSDFNKKNFAGKKNWSLLTLTEINYLTTKNHLDFIGLDTLKRVWIEYSNVSGMASSFNLLNNVREITSSTKDMCSIVLISQ